MKLNNKAYDILKWVALIALDALGLCYKSLSAIWGLPFGDAIYNTCVVLSTCIGALIGISTAQYYKDNPVPHDKDIDWKEAYYTLLDEYSNYRHRTEEETYSPEDEDLEETDDIIEEEM